MNHSTSPDPEFATPEEAEAYDRWFREQVEAALADPGPFIPHEQAIEEIKALIEARRRTRTSNRS